MQPAYYENFDEIIKKIWLMLDDAVTNRSSQFRIPVFICGTQNDFDGRIVVLRKSDQKNHLIQFHSDIRSDKIEKLKSNNSASLVFYDKEEKIQVRAKVECIVNHKNEITKQSWLKTAHISRKCYLVDDGPGTESDEPTSGLKPKKIILITQWKKVKKDMKISQLFNAKLNLLSGYILQLKGHRRAKFEYANNLGSETTFIRKTWLVP